MLIGLAHCVPSAFADVDVCTAGSGAGQCSNPRGVAVDHADGLLYVLEQVNNRVSVFDADTREFVRAFGGDVIVDGASGTGKLSAGSTTISAVVTISKVFEVGQTITGTGIPPETKIVAVGLGTITLSKAVTASGPGVALSVAEGAGNVPSNEVQTVTIGGAPTGGTFTLTFRTPNPSASEATATAIPRNASAEELESKLKGLSNVGDGDVAVSGPSGGPWKVEFQGTRFADTDVLEMTGSGGGLTPSGTVTVTSANAEEVCSAPVAECRAGAPGTALGQFRSPSAIAVDNDPASPAFHDVYVVEGSNFRVQRFQPSGEPVLTFGKGVNSGTSGNAEICTAAGPPTDICGAGSEGNSAGQFQSVAGIGVADPTGTVYVADAKNAGDCLIPGVGGNAFTKRVQKFSSSGAFVEQILPTDAPCGAPQGFTVDPSGNFYLSNSGGSGAVRKYDPTGTPFGPPYPIQKSFNLSAALAVDPLDDELFIGDIGPSGEEVDTSMYRYDAARSLDQVIYGNGVMLARPVSLAPHSTPGVGDIFAASGTGNGSRVTHLVVPLLGPVIFPFGERKPRAKEITSTKATLEAEINPEGKATKYHFEYVDAETCEEDEETEGPGHCFDQAKRAPAEASEDPEVGSTDFKLKPVELEIGCPDPLVEAGEPESKCLTPQTEYRFQVLASNADGPGNSPVEGEPFKTLDQIVFGALFATNVGTVEATLHGEVNPLGIAATGWFEYVDDVTYQADVEAGGDGFSKATKVPDVDGGAEPIDFGEGEGLVPATVQLGSLTPGTTYHYRLAAEDPLFEVTSEGEIIRTFEKRPPIPPCPNDSFRGGPSGLLPDCRAYELVSPVDKGGGDIEALFEGYDQAAPDGNSITYTAFRAFGEPKSAPLNSQYLARRNSAGWQNEAVAPRREGPKLHSSPQANTQRQFKLFTDDLCSAWLLTETEPQLDEWAPAGYSNLYRRDNCGPGAGVHEALVTAIPEDVVPGLFVPKVQAVSANGFHAVFTIPGRLVPQGVFCPKADSEIENGCTRQLYEHLEGVKDPRLVCILPEGTPSADPCAAGYIKTPGGVDRGDDDAFHAVSADGSRIFWTEGEKEFGSLYVRIEAKETIEIFAGPGGAHFRTAATDGSTTIYNSAAGELYEFDVEAALAKEGDANKLIAAGGVTNVLGASEDASRVYFVSSEALTGEEENSNGDKAEAGEPNLYLHERGGGLTFVATLFSDPPQADNAVSASGSRSQRIYRVSPDGGHMAFVSKAQATGYDNTDAVSGKADDEVFLYDAAEGQLRCISCNPSGGRPVGRDLDKSAPERWAAARLPGGLSSVAFSNILSDDGERLFFESVDPLVLRDTNGAIDIYQWSRADGEKECEEAGADLFNPDSGGCISLISSGKSPSDSELVDASADGADVFFKTQSSLLPQDPRLTDVYDARMGGGFAQPVSPSACEGEACQSPPPPPEEVTPASSAFEGQGNANEEAKAKARRCPKGKRRVKRQGKVRCVKRQRKSANRRARANGRAGR